MQPDEELVELVAGGDESGLEVLYERYARPVYSLLLRMIPDRQVTDELTQEVFLRVWRRAGSYSADKGRPANWILGIAHHLAVDELRRQGAQPRLVRDDPEVGRSLPEVAGASPDPHELTLQVMRRRRISEALAELPMSQREVLVLAYFGGLRQSEIAELQGVPLGTVKTRLRLALGRLRSHLKARGVDWDAL